MLSKQQMQFRDDFLSPVKQRLYYFKNLPMALFSGIKLVTLDEAGAKAEVPFRWSNKNPFNSMYFAVQSMAAELSTAALVFMALKGLNTDVAFIIIDMKVEFVKKAQSKITFLCQEYESIYNAVEQLNKADDAATIVVKTIGRDVAGDDVAIFYFTWSFKRRA